MSCVRVSAENREPKISSNPTDQEESVDSCAHKNVGNRGHQREENPFTSIHVVHASGLGELVLS